MAPQTRRESSHTPRLAPLPPAAAAVPAAAAAAQPALRVREPRERAGRQRACVRPYVRVHAAALAVLIGRFFRLHPLPERRTGQVFFPRAVGKSEEEARLGSEARDW